MTYESTDHATILKDGLTEHITETWVSTEEGIPSQGAMKVDGETYIFNMYDPTATPRPLYTYSTVSPLVLESIKENFISVEGAYSQWDAQIYVETFDGDTLVVTDVFFKNLEDNQIPADLPQPEPVVDSSCSCEGDHDHENADSATGDSDENDLAAIVALLTGGTGTVVANADGTATITLNGGDSFDLTKEQRDDYSNNKGDKND